MTNVEQTHTPQKCIYCGNNPTSHFGSWFDSMLGLALNPLFQTIITIPGGKIILNGSEYILDRLWDLSVLSGIISFHADPVLAPTDRGRVLCVEAVARGWHIETARVFGKFLDVYRISFPTGKKLVFSGLPRLDASEDASANWIDDKAKLKERLMTACVPVSRGRCVSTWNEAEVCFSGHDGAVIVKPRLGSRGRHTTTHIRNIEDLKKAFALAKQLGHFVIVEEHLVGSVYRATMIDRKLVGVLAGDPPRVTGSGEHTIAELIIQKNKNRHERVGEYKITELTPLFLARQGHSFDTILEKGKTIDLSEKIGLSYGGNAREVTPLAHPQLRAELERAAQVVDDPIIGFDFITPDVSVDPDTVRWGIIECNALPFINLHHDPLEGEPINVAGIFLDYIERKMD